MGLVAIDHVQLAMPAGREADAVAFYEGLLGLPQQQKPPHLAVRGGCWFGEGDVRIHLGVEADFRPARKAHPAFLVDLDAVAVALTTAGYEVVWADPAEIPGRRRLHTYDAVGNRIEFIDR